MEIRDRKGLVTGIFYLATGCGAAIAGVQYSMGTTAQMGPGYFPVLLGCVLSLLGLSVIWGSLRPDAEVTNMPRIEWAGLFWISLSIAVFALTLLPLGMVAATFLLVMVSTAGNTHRNWLHSLICAAFMVALTVGVFIVGLGIPLPVWPSFLN